MRLFNHVMIDLEDMGLNDQRVAVSEIGLVIFNKLGIEGRYQIYVNLNGQEDRHFHGATVEWHLKMAAKTGHRRPSGRPEKTDEPKLYTLEEAAQRVAELIDEHQVHQLWCNHPQHDESILANVYQSLGMKIPYHYRDVMDYSFPLQLASHRGWDDDRKSTHIGVEDAELQVDRLLSCLEHNNDLDVLDIPSERHKERVFDEESTADF